MGHTNYNKFQQIKPVEQEKKVIVDQDETPVKTLDIEPEISTTDEVESKFIGIVCNTEKLNVRESNSLESNVITVINKNMKVSIDTDFEDEEFYKIKMDDIEGYCMKEYIQIKEV